MRRTLCALALTLAACGGGGSTGPANPGGGNGTFTAVIDGQAWAATTTQVTGNGSGSNQVPGLIIMTGTKIVSATNYTTVMLNLAYVAGPGTYPLGVNYISTAGGGGQVTVTQGGTFSIWSTGFPGNAGTVTVTSLTSSRIAGTFQFTAPPQAGTSTTGTKVVTNGAFNMPLPAGFTVPPANNLGSKVSATIGGTAWNAATIVALGSNNVVGFTGGSDIYTISYTPGTTVTAGTTYPIGGPFPGGTLMVQRHSPSQSWTSGGTTAVGSITFTTYGGGRATGTFSATLSGSGGALVITNGTFDVRVSSP